MLIDKVRKTKRKIMAFAVRPFNYRLAATQSRSSQYIYIYIIHSENNRIVMLYLVVRKWFIKFTENSA